MAYLEAEKRGARSSRPRDSLSAGRPDHIFNLDHGIVPNTPVDSVLHVVDLVKRHGRTTPHAPSEATSDWAIRARTKSTQADC